MKQVWKFPISIVGRLSVQMPEDAEILSAAMQGETLCLWALVNPKAVAVSRIIHIAGTGHDLEPATRRFIATVHHRGLVWHVFEKK